MKDRKFYIGFTTDLRRRLTEHFSGFSKSTNHRRILHLIFCEYFLAKDDAMRRERYFKSSVGKKGLKFILRKSLLSMNDDNRNAPG